MRRREIEVMRRLLQKRQDSWGEFELGFYVALCKVLGDRRMIMTVRELEIGKVERKNCLKLVPEKKGE